MAAANVLGVIIVVVLLFYEEPVLNISLIPVFLVALLIVLFLSVCLVRECGKYKNAVLIKENQIMCFQVAKMETENPEGRTDNLLLDSTDVYISCFGVLFDSEVIKFNVEGISLKNVVIGQDYLSFVYRSNGRSQTLRILHGQINRKELVEFMERMMHETGVAPEVED